PAKPHSEGKTAYLLRPSAPSARAPTGLTAPMPGPPPLPSVAGRLASREPSPTRAAPPAPAPQMAQADMLRDHGQREHVPDASEPVGRDKFANAPENAFKVTRDAPVSTFSIDVDTASY